MIYHVIYLMCIQPMSIFSFSINIFFLFAQHKPFPMSVYIKLHIRCSNTDIEASEKHKLPKKHQMKVKLDSLELFRKSMFAVELQSTFSN